MKQLFKWQEGRQKYATYYKMLLATARWPLPFDIYILKYPQGSELPVHVDNVPLGKHHRLNIVLKKAVIGGEFVSGKHGFTRQRVVYFRPDVELHGMTKILKGTRYVLSIGWVTK